jgi:hypothetical protein
MTCSPMGKAPDFRDVAGGLDLHVFLAQLFQRDVAFHGQRQQGSRKGIIAAQTLVMDVVNEGRRDIVRCIPARHDGAALRIAANAVPGPVVIQRDEQEACKRDQCSQVVADVPGHLLRVGGPGHAAGWHPDGNTQAFAPGQRSGGLRGDDIAAIADACSGVVVARAKPAGIGDNLFGPRTIGQDEFGPGVLDGEVPEIARDVPEQLVMGVEKPDLPVSAIGDLVGEQARPMSRFGIADVQACGAAWPS